MKVKDTITYLIGKIRDIYPQGESRAIAFLVLEHLGIKKTDLVLKGETEVDQLITARLESIASELCNKRPVQHILGVADFYGLKFRVNGNVLIPRSETEELVDLIIKENQVKNPEIFDIGTGSGCIAVCLAKFIPGSFVTATDISEKSIETAIENADFNSVKVKFFQDDLFNTKLTLANVFDILVSNPPYVTESEKLLMHQNVLNFEPEQALFVPDDDPLRYYSKIGELGEQILKPGGKIFVEINEKFGRDVMELFGNRGFKDVNIIRDIHDRDRIVKAKKV